MRKCSKEGFVQQNQVSNGNMECLLTTLTIAKVRYINKNPSSFYNIVYKVNVEISPKKVFNTHL